MSRFFEHFTGETVWHGPRLTANWMETSLYDGGCPAHPINRANLLERVFGRCHCIGALHVCFGWQWGDQEWIHVAELIWPARLRRKRYQSPRSYA